MIRLESANPFFLLRHLGTGKTILIQDDWDYPCVARDFGWSGSDDQIADAAEFLHDNIGECISDQDTEYFNLITGEAV